MAIPPEAIERVIDTYRRAAEANWQTPSRQGNLIALDPENADDLMVSADLHGHGDNFDRLCEIADLAGRPRRHLVMQEVCHGGPTYPSGAGCMSHRLLENVAMLKTQYPRRFHFLLGNHELAELTDFPIVKANQVLNVMFRCGLMETYGDQTDRVREAYAGFLRSCPLAVRIANRILVCHSAPENVDARPFDSTILHRSFRPEDLTPQGDVFRLVWGRDYRQANAEAFAHLVDADVLIHGHEPCPEGFLVPNRTQIILDTSGDNGTYVIVPVAEKWTHQQVVQHIRRLRE